MTRRQVMNLGLIYLIVGNGLGILGFRSVEEVFVSCGFAIVVVGWHL